MTNKRGSVAVFGSVVIVAIVVFIAVLIEIERKWSNLPTVEWPAKLEKCNYKPSTLRYHSVPVVNSEGRVSVAMASSGHSEKHITVWNLGKYGRKVCDDEKVYRYATDEAILLIKVWDEDIIIVGIKR